MLNLLKFCQKHWWSIALLALSASGVIAGISGFSGGHGYGVHDGLYETLRMFFFNLSSEELMGSGPEVRPEHRALPYGLQWARWLIAAAFLWATFGLFIKVALPRFFDDLKILLWCRGHIVICGLNTIAVNIAKEFGNRNIVLIAEEANKYAEVLRSRGVNVLTSDLSGEDILRKAKIGRASAFYAVTDSDKTNVRVMQAASSVLGRSSRAGALKCFVLVKDRGLKSVLGEAAWAKCDAMLFNVNEMGIKYGVSTNVDKILPAKMDAAPTILLVGLSEKTEVALLNLAHCLTMRRESFGFTVLEKDVEKIGLFERKCAYLKDFAEIRFTAEINAEERFSAVIVCLDDQTEAIKRAVGIYYLLGENAPSIVVFCDAADAVSDTLGGALEKRRIFLVNLFEQVAGYVFKLNEHIEASAKMAHRFWNAAYKMDREWDALSGHFKQSNRNQVLDNYLRIYAARGQKFEDFRDSLTPFSDYEKETLAIMEHRRWMLEKYADGWTFGKRDAAGGDPYKRHGSLIIQWDGLSEADKSKDMQAIDLMMKLLNSQ